MAASTATSASGCRTGGAGPHPAEHLGAELDGADLSGLALAASCASGADCERFVRGARRRAGAAGRPLAKSDLEAEIPAPSGLSLAEMWIAAVHEAGHAVAGCLLRPGTVAAVSLRGSDADGGQTAFASETEAFVTADGVHGRIVVLFAGRAAEEAVIGVPRSPGAVFPAARACRGCWRRIASRPIASRASSRRHTTTRSN